MRGTLATDRRIQPMLAGAQAERSELDAFVADDSCAMEEKFDGHRGMVVTGEGSVSVLNRAGDPRVHRFDRRPFEPLANVELAIDGEVVGDTFVVFDLARWADAIDADTPYWSFDPDKPGRRQLLERLFSVWQPDPAKVRLAAVARSADEKRRLVDAVWAGGREGVMVKSLSGTYEPGGRSLRVVKVKNTKTIDAIVVAIGEEDHNSATLAVLDPSKDTVAEAVVRIGKASLNGKERWGVVVGSVVTARYLSCFPDEMRLVQCRLEAGPRDDKSYAECTIDQLVFSSKEELNW